MKTETFAVKAGDVVTFKVLEWFHEGWEFGRPAMMLEPVIRIEHDGSAESLIERVCLDLACNDNPLERLQNCDRREIEWRGWNLATLRRRFSQAVKGKRFPVAGYASTVDTVRFQLDERGDLEWCDAK